MFKPILAAIAGLALTAAPVLATSWQDIKTLTELVSGTGTEILLSDECNQGIHGYYQFSSTRRIDNLVICRNNVDMTDPDAVWEVLVHEATHVMQACNGGPIVKDTYLPRMLRELQETAPHYYNILQGYRGSHKRAEIEAFWMELRSTDTPIQWIQDFCYRDDGTTEASN